MVGVDEQLDAFRRPLLQTRDADLGGVHELTVHRERAGGVDQIPDRAAAADEHPDAAPQLLELRHGRSLRRGRLRPARTADGEARKPQRRRLHEVAAIHGKLLYPRILRHSRHGHRTKAGHGPQCEGSGPLMGPARCRRPRGARRDRGSRARARRAAALSALGSFRVRPSLPNRRRNRKYSLTGLSSTSSGADGASARYPIRRHFAGQHSLNQLRRRHAFEPFNQIRGGARRQTSRQARRRSAPESARRWQGNEVPSPRSTGRCERAGTIRRSTG